MTTLGLRSTVLATTIAALLAIPVAADAQAHRVAVARPRTTVSVGVGGSYYRPYYYRPYYYRPYYGFYGFGYGYGSGFGFSIGFPWAYPSYGYGGYGYGYGGYGAYQYPYYYGPGYYDGSSSLRLQVSPKEAEVYIDGYFAGTVDNFDGTFQRLRLEPGEHNLELFMPGHRSFTQKIYLQPSGSFRVRHEMAALGAGEPEPIRPVAAIPPANRTAQGGERPAGPDRPTTRGPQRPYPPRTNDQDSSLSVQSDFGSIALRVQPGDAMITIDGERWEGARDQDRLVVQLGAGTHNVEIRKDGYRTYITDLTVRPGETTALNVSLTRQ